MGRNRRWSSSIRRWRRNTSTDEDPIGKQIGDTDLSPKSLRQIVGIVDDVREGGLDTEIWPAEYQPFNQSTDNSFSLVVRTSQAPQTLLPALVRTIHEIDRGIVTLDPTRWQATHRDFAVGLYSPLHRLAGGRVRANGVAARRGGALRSDRLLSQPANARNRRAHGARRRTRQRLPAHPARGRRG